MRPNLGGFPAKELSYNEKYSDVICGFIIKNVRICNLQTGTL
jgi:hypothetical protein